MVVNLTKYTLFLTSQYDVILTFGVGLAKFAADPSPGCSSRGAKNQKEGPKNRRGGHIFKIQYWMYAATGGPNLKWWSTDFKWGAGHHRPPRWRRTWFADIACLLFCTHSPYSLL